MKETEILVVFYDRSIDMLIPKRRGEGFLRTPIGHHHSPLAAFISDLGYDAFGLDGHLSVQTGYISHDRMPEWTEKVVAPIAAHLGFPYRLVSPGEYWAKHPIPPSEDGPSFFR